MNWLNIHNEGAALAFEAHHARKRGLMDKAIDLFLRAAALEEQALEYIDQNQIRSRGIVGVSACSLYFKGRDLASAERLALSLMSTPLLPAAKLEMQSVMQAVWNETVKRSSESPFRPGEIIVSISGPETLPGGAPIDMVLDRIRTIQNIFYRTVEYASRAPLRRRGPPASYVTDLCKPWLFPAPAGSYQFAVAIQGSPQLDFFDGQLQVDAITETFLQIVKASSDEDRSRLEEIVLDSEYVPVLRRLTQSLRPKRNQDGVVKIYSYDFPEEIVLERLESYSVPVRESVRLSSMDLKAYLDEPAEISGILRALDLDRDWLELVDRGITIKIYGLHDMVDDYIGPLVNRKVIVTVSSRGKRFLFIDIRPTE